jgi:transposase InsO family protein
VKTELVVDAQWRSPSDAREALRHYINWYNGQRLHSTLDYLSPAAYEARLTAA